MVGAVVAPVLRNETMKAPSLIQSISRARCVASALIGFLEAKNALSRDLNRAREAAMRTASDEEERALHARIQQVGKDMMMVIMTMICVAQVEAALH